MLKKLLATSFIGVTLLTLPGCFGGEDNGTVLNDKDFTTYQGTTLSIPLPREWDILEKKDFTAEVSDNTEVIFRNNVKNDIYTANINIIVIPNNGEKSSIDKAREIFNEEKSGIIGYQELQREEITLRNAGNEDGTEIITFEGKNTAEEDVIRYQQVILAKKDKAYIATGSYKQDEEEKVVNLINTSLKNFELK